MKNKILLGVLIIIVIITGITLFTNKKENKQEDSLQRIMDKGTFVLGLDDSFPPMGFRNENNEIVGFDIDVAKDDRYYSRMAVAWLVSICYIKYPLRYFFVHLFS